MKKIESFNYLGDHVSTREKLIDFILNGYPWKREEFSRSDIEIYDGEKCITSRIAVLDGEFDLSIVVQRDNNGDGSVYQDASWDDVDRISYINGKLKSINSLITDNVYEDYIKKIVEKSGKEPCNFTNEIFDVQGEIEIMKRRGAAK